MRIKNLEIYKDSNVEKDLKWKELYWKEKATLGKLEIFEIELKKNNKNVNTDKFKIEDFESNVILYSRDICTGHDFSCATKVDFVGFKEDFFETNEGKQLKSRFDRIRPTYLCQSDE